MSIKTLNAIFLKSVVPHLDLSKEEAVTFSELARRVGRRRANRPTHVGTCHRWRLQGLNGIRLAAVKQGGIWVTTIEAYQRFVDALTRAASPDECAPPVPPCTTPDQTENTLEKLGL